MEELNDRGVSDVDTVTEQNDWANNGGWRNGEGTSTQAAYLVIMDYRQYKRTEWTKQMRYV